MLPIIKKTKVPAVGDLIPKDPEFVDILPSKDIITVEISLTSYVPSWFMIKLVDDPNVTVPQQIMAGMHIQIFAPNDDLPASPALLIQGEITEVTTFTTVDPDTFNTMIITGLGYGAKLSKSKLTKVHQGPPATYIQDIFLDYNLAVALPLPPSITAAKPNIIGQYNQTTMAFLDPVLKELNLTLWIDKNIVHLIDLKSPPPPNKILTYTYGKDLVKAATTKAPDPSSVAVNSWSKLDGSNVAGFATGPQAGKTQIDVFEPNRDTAQVAARAQAIFTDYALSTTQFSGEVPYLDANIQPGMAVKLIGVKEVSDTELLRVTTVTHTIDRDGDASTEFSCSGPSSDLLFGDMLNSSQNGTAFAPEFAFPQLANISAVRVAPDPNQSAFSPEAAIPLIQVQVEFVWLNSAIETPGVSGWADVLQGADLWLPFVGEQVYVLCVDGDPNKLIVLGKVFNKSEVPPATDFDTSLSKMKNRNISWGNYVIKFDSSVPNKELLTIQSAPDAPGVPQSIALYQEKGGGLKIETGAAGFELDASTGNIIFKNAQEITFESVGDININSQKKVTITGAEVDIMGLLGTKVSGVGKGGLELEGMGPGVKVTGVPAIKLNSP